MSTSLAGKTAVVTGGAQGVGRGVAASLLEKGARVVLADIEIEAAHAAANELDPMGESVFAVPLDVRSEASFRAALDAAEQRFGPLDALVNNAARTSATSIWEITAEEWDDVQAVNLRGAFFGCRLAGERMRGRGGRIVNLVSLAGQWGRSPTGIHYAASKAGIIGLTRVFANALAADGVTVNAIAPSVIDGPQVRAMPEQTIARYVEATIPLGRVGQPREVGDAIAFLVSDESSFITGVTLDVNGGALMR
jgi:3-oxoacyl-[acyl-carrier protein] reductase